MQEAVTRMPKPLDREKWHRPLVSIIVTHHNYSAHLEDCLRSILDQTHENWECVVVDDCSSADETFAAGRIINQIAEPRIRFLALEENVGQIPAFFAGMDATKGEFICALDPDDRYAETFLAEMVAAHLNPIRAVPLISCEQRLLRGDQLISGVVTGHAAARLQEDAADGKPTILDNVAAPEYEDPPEWRHEKAVLRYFPPTDTKWRWSSTSGMMFRRPVLKALRPHRDLGYKGDLDAWLAPGVHALGGSMFLNRPLLYRGIHGNNDWIREDFWATSQRTKLPCRGAKVRADALEAIIANGYEADLARAKRGKRTMSQRLRRSFAKRLDRLMGVMMEKGR